MRDKPTSTCGCSICCQSLKFSNTGAVACVWFVAWMFLVYRTPGDDPRISKEEKDYIESAVGRKEVFQIRNLLAYFTRSL